MANPNNNWLKGFWCPSCGSFGPFHIRSSVLLEVYDDGTEAYAQAEWGDDAFCVCPNCCHKGKVWQFKEGGQPPKPVESTENKPEPTDPNKVTRGSVLQEAFLLINGERQTLYGAPEDSFATIAGLWSVYLEQKLTGYDVGVLMALLKIARIRSGVGTKDSFADCAGYIGLAHDMLENEKGKRNA